MKLTDIKRKLMEIEPDAEEVTVSFDFLASSTEVRVDWWVTTEQGIDSAGSKEYTIEEFKRLVCDHTFKWEEFPVSPQRIKILGTCTKCGTKATISPNRRIC